MDRGVLLPDTDAVDATALGERAAGLGYDAVWAPELWGGDAFVRLTDLAHRTEEVRLGTAIVNVYSRSPAAIAQASATLQEVSGGRFTLGLGVSTPKAIEDLHGLEFERPARRAHETIDLVRQFSGGEGRVNYDGELVSVADFPALETEVPIYYAALGPANRRVVGRLADGWIPHNVPFGRLEEAFEVVAETAREAGRDPDEITIAPYVPSAVSEDPDEARDAIRGHVAYYVGSGDGYRRAVGAAFPEADAVAEAWREGDRREAAARVTDEMVDALGVAGTPEDARQQLETLEAETPIDHAIVVVPAQAAGELTDSTVEALAPK